MKREKAKVNVIIFDLDGVIIDSGEDIANAVNHTLEKYGREKLSKEEIINYVGFGGLYLIRMCFKGSDEDTIQKAFVDYKSYYYDNPIVKTRLYPGVEEILERFKDKKMAVVTNKPQAIAMRILEKFGVLRYFGMVLGPESLKRMKPDPEGLVKVLDHFGEKPELALMTGDSHTDIEAGKSIGTLTCGVTYGLGSREKLLLSSPDFVVDDIRKLASFIR